MFAAILDRWHGTQSKLGKFLVAPSCVAMMTLASVSQSAAQQNIYRSSDSSEQIVSPSDVVVSPNANQSSGSAASVINSSQAFANETQPLPPIENSIGSPVGNPVGAGSSLPGPPKSAGTVDRLIQRIKENADTAPPQEVVTQPKVDISGESIREEVRKKYDAEFAEDFADDGWADVENGWKHKTSGRVLMDSVMWTGDNQFPGGLRNYFEMRQLRLGLNGRGYGAFEYKLEMEFEPEFNDTSGGATVGTFGTVSMKDAFVGLRDAPLFGNIRIGHQKVNFSLQQMLSRTNMTFLERSPMADPPGFTPGREVGISSLNQTADQNQTLGYGIYIDNISESSKEIQNDNQGFVMGGRHTYLPYYDEPSNGRYLVHFGTGGIYRQAREGAVRFRARPELHEGPRFVDTGTILADDYRVFGGEFAVQSGPLTLMSEIMYADVNEVGDGELQMWSGYVQGAWRLTGEHRNYNRFVGIFDSLIPYENFWMLPGSQGIGAWEVAARYSYVDLGDSPVSSQLSVSSLALNWYWNPSIRLQANYIHAMTNGNFVGDTSTDALGLRMSVYF